MNLPNQNQILAFSRHLVSYAGGAVTAISMAHLWQNPVDAQTATNAIEQVGHGFAEMIAGVATLATVGMGVIAAAKASPLVQMLMGAYALLHGKASAKDMSAADQKTIMEATGTLPKVQAVVTNDPVIAATTSPVVVSSTSLKP